MIAGIRRVGAGTAEPGNARLVEHVVETRHSGDVDAPGVEHLLAARDRLAILGLIASAAKAQPRPVEIEDVVVEVGVGKKGRIIYSLGEWLQRQCDRAAGRTGGMQIVDAIIENLSSGNAALERDNLILL